MKPVVHHADDTEEIRAHDVHLVDVGHAGHTVLAGLLPDHFRLGLDTALGAEYSDSAVEYAQRTLNFHGKVDVAGGVDYVDGMTLPLGGGSGRGNGDAALLLLSHPVHRRAALMGLTQTVYAACVKQDALCRGGLAGVDVGHDANVTDHVKRMRS